MIILEILWQHHLPNLLLHQEIKKQTSKPDIIIGNETWLNKNVLSSEVFPSTLFEDVFHNDRESREGGGVLIAIKKGIVCQEVFKREKVELIAEQINITDTKSLIIVSAYRPPSKTDIDY